VTFLTNFNKNLNLFKDRVKDPYSLNLFKEENVNIIKSILEEQKPISLLESLIDIDYLRKDDINGNFVELYDKNNIEEIVLGFFTFGDPTLYNYFLKNKKDFMKLFGCINIDRIDEIERIFDYNKIDPELFAYKNNIVFKTLFDSLINYGPPDQPLAETEVNGRRYEELLEFCDFFKIKVKDSFRNEHKFYRCSVCSESYRNVILLKEHLLSHN